MANGCDWEASAEGDALKMQRVHTAQIYAHTLKSFHHDLPVPESVDVALGQAPKRVPTSSRRKERQE